MNASSPWRLTGVAVLLVLALAIAGCQSQDASGEASAPASGPAAVIAEGSTTTPPVTRDAVPAETPAPTATPPPTPRDIVRPTASPTPTPAPTATPTPTPTATPAPRAVQLTTGGCCTQPFWAPDSTQVRFIDKRGSQALAGIWGVPAAEPGAEPAPVSDRVEESLATGDYLVETSGNSTSIRRLSDGTLWSVPAGGRSVLISPSRTHIAWTAVDDDLPPERQVAVVWVANLDGSDARKVATLRRGGLSGWISEDRLLVNGRESSGAREQVLWALSLQDGGLVEVARAERLRSPTLSPSGNWVAYYVTFAADPAQNGLWLARTDGSLRRPAPRELFGAYQWRPCPAGCSPEDERLLIVPFKPDTVFHELWEMDAGTGQARQLTDPAITPFKIANGDWRVSPDGRRVAYVESKDRNIWVIELP
jgi:Tol biopolymer transport system component